ncbi:MAG: pyridine nucleotide-disulfide oxidoreductase [Spirochaetes bacterium]|nr:pyridine nucleotide-disulfide oxidoreductase [Spirochaetota bacterium]
MDRTDVLIVGTGPAGLAAAFEISSRAPRLTVAMIDREKFSTGGLRNDCKMNFTYPIGFPVDVWTEDLAKAYLARTEEFLKPPIMDRKNVSVYARRAEKIGVRLLEIRQAHLGTDGGLALIKDLTAELMRRGVAISLGENLLGIDAASRVATTDRRELSWGALVVAPGRSGFSFVQSLLTTLGVPFTDNVVDIGVRVETREGNYQIVKDYYDPKFIFPEKTRTFCTNSRTARVVQEKYVTDDGRAYYSVNGHAYADEKMRNGLANFAMLRTVEFTEPLASGQRFAEMLGIQAALMGGGRPIMQRIGDFRLGKRSKLSGFSGDLYDFEPTLASATPGDISLAAPSKILRAIWKSLKALDTIVPGVLHPSTIMYYPEIKLYANRPTFADGSFRVADRVWMIGDGAGTSRGITAAWSSGLRAADGIMDALRD